MVATLSEEEILGWSWLLILHQRKFHARAMEPVRAIALDGMCLRDGLEIHPVSSAVGGFYKVPFKSAGILSADCVPGAAGPPRKVEGKEKGPRSWLRSGCQDSIAS
jgi:hypothetical protein